MGDGLMWISENPARTFWEAVQAAIMYQLFLAMDSGYPALAFGRFDQYTWPFLKADLEAGRITMDEAQEIVDAFFLKVQLLLRRCAALPRTRSSASATPISTPPSAASIPRPARMPPIPSPTWCSNPSAGFCCTTRPSPCASTRTPRTSSGIALSRRPSSSAVCLCSRMTRSSSPALVEELGFELRDARDYGLIGCQEIVGSGNDYPAPQRHHTARPASTTASSSVMALNNGINPFNGEQCSIKTGYLYDMKSVRGGQGCVSRPGRSTSSGAQVTMNNYTEYLTMYLSPACRRSPSPWKAAWNRARTASGAAASTTPTAAPPPVLRPSPTPSPPSSTWSSTRSSARPGSFTTPSWRTGRATSRCGRGS